MPLYAAACSNYFDDYYLGNLTDPGNTCLTNGAVYNNVLYVPPEKTDANGDGLGVPDDNPGSKPPTIIPLNVDLSKSALIMLPQRHV